jgi:hypothetical protein
MTRDQAATSLEMLAREIGRTSSLVKERPHYADPDEHLAMVRMLDAWEKRAFDIVRAFQADTRAPDAEHDPLCGSDADGEHIIPPGGVCCQCGYYSCEPISAPRPAEAPPSPDVEQPWEVDAATGLRVFSCDCIPDNRDGQIATVEQSKNDMTWHRERDMVLLEDVRKLLAAYPLPAALPVEKG